MNLVEIVKAYNEKIALEGPVEASTEIISEDFRFIAGTIEIDRKRFIAIMASVYAAIPDLAHTLSEFPRAMLSKGEKSFRRLSNAWTKEKVSSS